ncbi:MULTISPECIES: MEDS domain-containing protein [Mesobacillus]|uniref:MEDS domain-containing protein n=1 Tax=Mesobacillus selenatarsenatis TaxID=388741 RepID=A0A846TNK6_9BACI|nr:MULTISPECIES: MEDS domain-containing protein [Mesobacillus]NKE05745.1 hypothetical protein [Mesobacillus selenatarsenatis]
MKKEMNQLFKDQRSVHVLYSYNEVEKYIEQAVDFIEDGVIAGDYVIFIENEPLFRSIHKKLKSRLTEDQMKFVHSVNNFDFYYSSGSYHPPAILEYFNKTVRPYIENAIPFRSWAHVEWATMKDPLDIIEDFERIVDEAVNSLSFPLICAYEGAKMPDHLLRILMETHPYVLKDDKFTISAEYQATADLI